MKIKYFHDTDTVYVQLTDQAVTETKDVDENTLIDLDVKGDLVGITIEHARRSATMDEFSFQQIAASDNIHV